MPQDIMPQDRRKEFSNWFESVVEYLEGQYSDCELYLEAGQMNRTHWNQLWRIFENSVERTDQGNKESMEVLEAATHETGGVVLDAYGKNYDELNWQQQMDHYLNSGKYD